jgi:glycosyltransferase involved in cell wall biosynthesis
MSDHRRILILNERDLAHPRAGGAELHVAKIFSRLARRGHHVHQYSSSFPGAAPSERQGTDEHPSNILIERIGPLPRYYTSIPIRLSRARRSREFDVVIECLNKLPFYSPLFAGSPVLALCHHLFGQVAFSQATAPIAAAVWLAERGIPYAYRKTRFVSISESTRDELVERGIAPTQIDVSHPGIDRPRCRADLESHRPRRITYLGRLETYKRVDLLFHAASRLVDRFPDLEIVVIGRGPERTSLERLARRLNLQSRTQFAGFVSTEERDVLLAASRACVFPSEKEGWGLTVIEANTLGTPVVASDVPGLRDSIRDGETGLLVEPGDIEGFASSLARLLEDTPFAYDMRRAALRWSQRFDWDRAADEMEAAIEKSIAATSRS